MAVAAPVGTLTNVNNSASDVYCLNRICSEDPSNTPGSPPVSAGTVAVAAVASRDLNTRQAA